MVKAIIFDLARVFLFPKKVDYYGELSTLHKVLSKNINFKFDKHFVFNTKLLDFIKENAIDTKFQLYIFASGKIQDTTECQRFLNGYFKKTFSAEGLSLSKKEASTYIMLADMIDLNPRDILFVDDMRQNTLAAETAGFSTITFRNNIQFETEILGYCAENPSKI